MKTSQSCRRTITTLVTILAATTVSPAATYLWNVASPGPNNWNVNANWTPATGSPGAGDTAVFSDLGAVLDAFTVNNAVSANTAVTALWYTNTVVGNWHVTQIPAGVTLSVTNLTVGLGTAAPGTGARTLASVKDGGTLAVYGNLTVGNNGTGATTGTTLDMAGLSNFVYSAPGGTIALSTGNRSAANMNLAAISNNITAATMNLNTSSSSSSASGTLNLGAGTNIINVGAWNQGAGRNSCTAQFPGGAAIGLRLRGVGGTDADLATMSLGNHNNSGGSGSSATGNLSLNGAPVDIRLSTLTLGRNQNATSTGTDAGNGTLSFDTGTVYASTILMAITTTANAGGVANGTINVGANGKLLVGAGGISLVNLTGGTATGTLNINGGSLICSNSILKSTTGGTGNVIVQAGSLTVNGTIGSAAVPVDTLQIGDSTLTLAVVPNVTNVVVVGFVESSTTNNTINITSLPSILSYPAQFPLISFQTGYSYFLLGSLPPGYQGSIANNPNSVDLIITSGPITRTLAWNGTPSGDWNTTTANWLFQGSPSAYQQNDYVTFDDTATGPTTVNLTTALTPGTLTVSNLNKAYTFNGSGSVGGAVALVKDGSGLLTLANSGANTFSNGVSILGGTVRLSGGADRLPTASVVTLADVPGAALDLNSLNQTLQSLNGGGTSGGNVLLGTGTLTDSGGGIFGGVISGAGQLIKTNFVTGGTLTLSNANTYSGGTIIGGYTNNTTLAVANPTGSGTGSGFVRVLTNGTFALGNGGPGGSTAAGVITNDGTLRLNRSDEFSLASVVVGSGAVLMQGPGTTIITGTNGYTGGTTVNPGTLRLGNSGALGTGSITVQNSAATLQLSNNITLSNSLSIASKPGAVGVVACVENISGSNALTGPLSLTQNGGNGWIFSAAAGQLLVSGPMRTLTGSQTSQNTTRILWLTGDAVGEWSGNIIDTVNSVTNVALRKDGLGTWILKGDNTYTGSTVVSNGVLLVAGRVGSSSTVTVNGGTLGGTGVISRPVVIGVDGTLAPGSSIGTLTINDALTMNGGTNVMEVSHSGCDQVVGVGSLTLGGTLQVVIHGSLTGGEVFKLYTATSYAGDFTTYDLPPLAAPLGWDSSSVPIDGTLRVTGALPVLQAVQTGNTLTFTWTAPGFKLQAQTNSLGVGLSGNWVDYPGGSTSPVNATVTPANPAVFFRLISQ